jgi:hypothetical protein
MSIPVRYVTLLFAVCRLRAREIHTLACAYFNLHFSKRTGRSYRHNLPHAVHTALPDSAQFRSDVVPQVGLDESSLYMTHYAYLSAICIIVQHESKSSSFCQCTDL